MPSAAGASPLSIQCAENNAATASPVPLGAISKPIRGVAIRHAASWLTATISTWSAGASARRRLVIRASRGPFEQAACGGERVGHGRDLAAGQVLQLEVVGRHQVGQGNGALAEEGVDAGLHVDAGVDVAQHRIAAPHGLGVGGAHLARGVEHDVAQGGIADIAGEQRVAARQQAQRLDAGHDVGDLIRRGRAATPGAIAGMVREFDRVYRPDLVAQSLQGKSRSPIADVAVGNMALKREKAHGRGHLATRRPAIIVRRVFREPICRRPSARAAASSICRAPTRARWRRPGPCRPMR